MNSVQNCLIIMPIYKQFVKIRVKMQNIKDAVHKKLLETGRRLVCEKGVEYLTARKLSEASECSVGTIYNQFGNMDEFVAEQNEQTLGELAQCLNRNVATASPYRNLTACLDIWLQFVQNNHRLWLLLYNFHLNTPELCLSVAYRRQMLALMKIVAEDFSLINPKLPAGQRQLALKVLLTSLFAFSSLLVTEAPINAATAENCRLLFNTYLGGLKKLDGEN